MVGGLCAMLWRNHNPRTLTGTVLRLTLNDWAARAADEHAAAMAVEMQP